MTVKDLHFSFDSALEQAQPGAGRSQESAGSQGPRQLAAVKALQPGVRRTAGKDRGRAWIVGSLVSLINMAFLVLAALWLTGNTYRVTSFPANTGSPATTAAAEDLRGGLDETARQLAELKAALAAQSELLGAIEQQLALLPAAAPVSREEEEVTAPPTAATPRDNWQITLGSFSSAAGAIELQKSLQAKGYAAQVETPESAKTANYRVWLGGYKDREAADKAAIELMDQTSLTGLWVWNGR